MLWAFFCGQVPGVALMIISLLSTSCSGLFYCSVGDEDPAVNTLVEHFKKVITEITDNKWSHWPSKWISKKDKQKLYVMDRKQLQDDRFLDMDPQPFFLAHHRLGEKLYRLREKVVCVFREIDYKKLTPLITKVFGSTDFIGIADSGINELFKPPRRGRPPKADAKKRQRQDFDVEYQPTTTSSRRNLRHKGLRKSSCESSSLRCIIIRHK